MAFTVRRDAIGETIEELLVNGHMSLPMDSWVHFYPA
jgi:hypothetical protein